MTEAPSRQTVIVTGGARGIGLCVAKTFATSGAHVVIGDLDHARGESAVLAIQQQGGQASFVPVDLVEAGEAARLVDVASGISGRLDVLVNNARAGQRVTLDEETEANWDLTVNVSLRAAFFASQAAVRVMSKTGGGAIVNIGSVASVLATNESPSYHAAKAGLLQLTKYLAVAAGRSSVRVNCVLPGLIVQEEHRDRFESSDNISYRVRAEFYQPLGKVGTESDVAEAVRFLTLPAASYISGACIVVDGAATVQEQFGMLLRLPKY